jgi:hypothetical protein
MMIIPAQLLGRREVTLSPRFGGFDCVVTQRYEFWLVISEGYISLYIQQ